ncbi:YheC/YheD family endospore coat-associated protein [Alkalihalobacillus sp. CinArs1]|uniref:YheC/YheD family endospore coat-associated protein n=1 Tax=Alkalihalobacillus sp. CinArs1 TaxID=2995314 RepID=UPI0022DDEFC2|nr:YheC/YheD family protein [Alkalihalobacillus sp. CinArs1]
MKHTHKVILHPLLEETGKNRLIIPEYLATRWHIENTDVFFKCGSLQYPVHLESYETNSDQAVYCSEEILSRLFIPKNELRVLLSFCKETSVITLGPIFCLTTNAQGKEDTPFSAYTDFCLEIAKYCEEHHIFFFVNTLKRWDNNSVIGKRWQTDQWIEAPLPLPSIIYNRIHSRRLENSSEIESLKELWRELNIPYFNEAFIDKWDVHEKLLLYEELAPYLPESDILDTIDKVEQMMNKYNTIYLKPINGSQGRHIYRISKSQDCYLLGYSSFSGNKVLTSPTLSGLYPAIRARSKKVPYLIQQGIPLFEVGDCPVDFRILCLKGPGDKWRVVSTVARVSQSKDQFVSNIARGGLIKSVDDVLSQFDKVSRKQIKRILPELALEVSKVIDGETDGMYGELGIDLSIDKDGHPWIIEVNTKPSKTPDHPSNTNCRPSVKALIQFVYWFTSN